MMAAYGAPMCAAPRYYSTHITRNAPFFHRLQQFGGTGGGGHNVLARTTRLSQSLGIFQVYVLDHLGCRGFPGSLQP